VILILPESEPGNVREAQAVFGSHPRIRILTTADPDKRKSLALGIQEATNEIVVLSDSDTLWEPDLLKYLLMPFDDPSIGGVGTRQRVLAPESSIWRRAADWMLDSKYLAYVPAMSWRGGVSVLSGRTVAYRRSILLPVLPDLVNERFFRRRCISGDDGRLTWLVLNQGYKTVYQRNAVAWTMMPDNATAFIKQRIRWSRNAYRCYLRAIFCGWLFRQPTITGVSVLQGLCSPLSLTIGFAFVGLAVSRGDYTAVIIWLCWIMCGRGIRAFDHLRANPRNIVLLPFMTAIILFVMTGIKYYSFFTMNKQAWITRREDREVVEGQSSDTVTDDVIAQVA